MNTKKSTMRKRHLFPRTLGETVAKVTKPVMKKHGLPDGLVEQWPRIAGADLTSYCTPVGCKRRKKDAGATLVVEVLPSHALIAQHASGVLIEKINLHYGYPVVERIQFQPATHAPSSFAMPSSNAPNPISDELGKLAAELKNTPIND